MRFIPKMVNHSPNTDCRVFFLAHDERSTSRSSHALKYRRHFSPHRAPKIATAGLYKLQRRNLPFPSFSPVPRLSTAMHFSSAFFSILGLSFYAQAQSLNVTGLISALQGAGLTSLATAAQRANETKAGQDLLSALVSGSNYTVFAPNNAAFDAPEVTAISNDPQALATILSYHVLPGNFINSSSSDSALDCGVYPAVTVGRTLLTNSTLVQLEGNKGQVVAWTRNDTSNSTIYFLNQSPEITVLSTVVVEKLLVATISGVLTPPRDLSEVAGANNLTALAGLVDMVNVPSFYSNGTNATVEQALEANSTHGFTLFAPNDEAFKAGESALTSLVNNQTALLTLLGNHYINGTSVYSPILLGSSSSNYVSASGQSFSFNTNSSGSFVTSSNSASARIIKSDVLVENGVIHVVDHLLVNLDRDESKASSAYQSATSVAGQPTTETGPIGPTSTSSSGTNTGTNTSGNGALALRVGVASAGGAVLVGALGWLAFIGLVAG
ncbi:hypothetical protein D9615_009668 [Tricholomella constricta]|uniref:FAS1 domain-containing protein n=1 Tax=Tricholomella constricta TaxID=117010 RepID=A0A8H5GUM0_9AGAR|nr:hypothetical protein D9615_009668 [Tricholomella constricta]